MFEYEYRPLTQENAWYTATRCQNVWTSDTRGIVAYRDGEPVAAVVFEFWTPGAARFHWCIDDPFVFRHGFLEQVAHFFFLECDRHVLHGFIVETNTKSRRLAEHVGFTEAGRLKDGWEPGTDLVIVEMRREDCRWIGQDIEEAA